jgi:hypothetical protein
VEAHSILPVVRNVNIGELFTIKMLTAYTTGFNTGEAVIYHETGQRSSFMVKLHKEATIVCPLPNRYQSLGNSTFHFHLFHGNELQSIQLEFKDGAVYMIQIADKQTLDHDVAHHKMKVYSESLKWETADENLDFLQGNVKVTRKPLDFSSFGQFSGYLGYESEFYFGQKGVKTIVFPRIEDPVTVLCNGKFIGKLDKLGADSLEVPVIKGINKLTCLVQNMGRYNYTQAMGEPKGISEAPALNGKYISLLGEWQVEGTGRKHHLSQIPKIEGRIAFLRSFTNTDYNRAMLVGEGVSRVKVNGKPVKIVMENQTAWSRECAVFGVADLSDALINGENVLDLDVQNVSSIRRFDLYLFHEHEQIFDWKMKPCAQLDEKKDWTIFSKESTKTVFPRWYRSHFSWSPYDGSIIKVRFNNMSKGCFWVNGRCLGRYWNIGPQEDYKIPASILRERNELIIFDEEGFLPDKVTVHSFIKRVGK